MPRGPRHTPAGTVQHFIARIAGGEHRVRGWPERRELTRRLGDAITPTDWRALAVAWMSNHEHLAAQAGEQSADAFLRPLHSGFATWLNERDGRFGYVYAGRPKNVTFNTEEAVANLLAYIHNNPVRAGVVVDPADSAWTTHRAYLGLERAPGWLDVERGLCLSGFDATGNGRANFHDFVRSRANLPRDPKMTGEHIASIRQQAREQLGPAVELTPVVQARAGATVLLREGGLVGATVCCTGSELVEAVATTTGVLLRDMLSRARWPDVVAARRMALLVWTHFWRRPIAGLAPVLGVTPQACGYLLRNAASKPDLLNRARQLADDLAEQTP